MRPARVLSPRIEVPGGTVFPPPPPRSGKSENLWLAKRSNGQMQFFENEGFARAWAGSATA